MKTNVAAFAQTPKTSTAVVTTATTNVTTDAPGNLVQLLQAGTEGGILTRLSAIPRATVTASNLGLYELLPTQAVATGTGTAETAFANYSEARPLRLEAGDRLLVGSQNATGIVFKAEWTDF
jgi:hypothetical protein